MDISTDSKGKELVYGESPHTIVLTHSPQFLVVAESLDTLGFQEFYCEDKIIKQDSSIVQEKPGLSGI